MAIDSLGQRRWILLPGTLCNAEVFDSFLDCVGVEKESRYPVSLRHAQPEDYLPELAELMCPGAIVCGFSLGALVAAHLADRLDAAAFVLFGLNPYADDPVKKPARLELQRAVREAGGRAALESRLPEILGPTPLQAKEHILSMADDTAQLIEEHTALALNRPGAMSALSAAQCPIRFLTGSEDSSAPFELAQAAADTTTDGQALVLKGLGHYALLENPELCYSTLKAGWLHAEAKQ